jgi:hypothetical protein
VDFFREAGLLHEVEAARDVEEVTADITAVLDRLDQRSPAG